jgi:hypothetical protein
MLVNKTTYNLEAIETVTVSNPSGTAPGYKEVRTYNCPMHTTAGFFTATSGPAGTTGTYIANTGSGWGTSPNYLNGYYKNGTGTLYTNATVTTIIANVTCQYHSYVPSNGHNGTDGLPGSPHTAETATDVQSTTTGQPYEIEYTGVKKDEGSDNPLTVMPNPGVENIMFTFSSEKGGTTRILIFDISGKKTGDITVEALAGKNSMLLDISTLPKGMYTLNIEHDQKIERTRFEKQ